MLRRFTGDGGWYTACSSILALTKADWNNNTLYKTLPVTLVYSQIFAEVVKQSSAIVNDVYDLQFACEEDAVLQPSNSWRSNPACLAMMSSLDGLT